MSDRSGAELRLRRHRLSAGIVAVCGLLATTYSLVTPAWESPDEVGHMAYVTHLVRDRTLPMQREGTLGEDHQPPLYYVLAALPVSLVDLDDPSGRFRFNSAITWANRGGDQVNAALHGTDETFPYSGQALALHAARLVSVLCACVTIGLIIWLGRVTFPDQPEVAVLAGILAAGNPQFVFIAGSVNNDNLLNALAAALLLCGAMAMVSTPSLHHWAWAAALATAAVLTKLSIAPVVVWTFGVLALRSGMRHTAVRLGLAAAIGVVAAGWWFARNIMLYGDPLGWSVFSKTSAVLLRRAPFHWSEYTWFLSTQFRSFWGVFGWMTIPAPAWFHRATAGLCGLALLGLALWIAGRSSLRRSSGSVRLLAALGLAALLQEAYLALAVRTFGASWYQGRYLFPVMAPLAVALSAGLLALLPARLRSVTTLAAGGVAVAVATWIAFHVIAPAYANGVLTKREIARLPLRLDHRFGGVLDLVSHDVARHGDDLDVTLYWRVLRSPEVDYAARVQLVDAPSGEVLAATPARMLADDRYPPRSWIPGDVVADPRRLRLPAASAGARRLTAEVSVLTPPSDDPLPVSTGASDGSGDSESRALLTLAPDEHAPK